jgi:MFS transporter, Spinster family, sphingosine-1-phosphate transporter
MHGRYALALLLGVNLLNYIDRQVLYAVFPLIKEDLHLSDAALGFLGSAFMLCYMVSAPLLGWLTALTSRIKVASGGLIIWSFATVFSGFAAGYRTLFASRTLVGIGEASFSTVSPGLISDYFPRERRGRVLSYFYLAIPVGSALGYLLGGIIGQSLGWHAAFLIVGLPGLLLSAPLYFLSEPLSNSAKGAAVRYAPPLWRSCRLLFRNRSFVVNTLSMSAMTFALGGLAQWIPSFLHRIHGLDVAKGNTLFGAITVIAGITGTLTGGWLGDRLQKKSSRGYLIVSGWGFLLGSLVAFYAIATHSTIRCLVGIFFAEFLVFLNTGPLNTVIVNVTSHAMRTMAFAVNIFFIHALGDAVSPTIIGWLSDLWGLRKALLFTPFSILLAAFFSFLCMSYIEADSSGKELLSDHEKNIRF